MKKILIPFAVVTLLALIVCAFAGFTVWRANEQGSATDDFTNSQTVEVEIKSFAYTPKRIKIKRGTTVIWTNRDSVAHTVTSDSGEELDSGSVGQDEAFEHKFATTGTFNYFCEPHPFMKGSVEVVD